MIVADSFSDKHPCSNNLSNNSPPLASSITKHTWNKNISSSEYLSSHNWPQFYSRILHTVWQCDDDPVVTWSLSLYQQETSCPRPCTVPACQWSWQQHILQPRVLTPPDTLWRMLRHQATVSVHKPRWYLLRGTRWHGWAARPRCLFCCHWPGCGWWSGRTSWRWILTRHLTTWDCGTRSLNSLHCWSGAEGRKMITCEPRTRSSRTARWRLAWCWSWWSGTGLTGLVFLILLDSGSWFCRTDFLSWCRSGNHGRDLPGTALSHSPSSRLLYCLWSANKTTLNIYLQFTWILLILDKYFSQHHDSYLCRKQAPTDLK